MAVLRVKAGPNAGVVYELGGEKITIGRELGSSIQVADEAVSRRHAEIFQIGELTFIEDLKSRNGTYLNDRKIEKEVLRNGDRIRVGGTLFVFDDRPEGALSARIRFHAGEDFSRTVEFTSPEDTAHPGTTAAPTAAGAGVAESRNLAALRAIADVLAAEGRPADMLSRALAVVAQGIDAPYALIVEKGGDHGEPYETTATYVRAGFDGDLAVSASVLAEAERRARPILVADALMDARFRATESIVVQRIRSILCVPLMVAKRVVGLLYAADVERPDAFSPEDLELAALASVQLAAAMESFKALNRQEATFRQAVGALLAAAEWRRPDLRGRAERIASYAHGICQALDLRPWDTRRIVLAALLHDVGTIALSDRELEDKVLLDIRKNRATERILGPIGGMEPVVAAIVNQNERYDGSGSPEGKKGDAIPLGAQVLGVAMHFDALQMPGLGEGEARPLREILQEIAGLAGRAFAPKVVDAFLRAYRKGLLFGTKSAVKAPSVVEG
ncbi:MAG: FHA domain-containing protein [Planctomycetes bacterium]|nr:FHA domain-containing protein [Planctomycetota bacterium]